MTANVTDTSRPVSPGHHWEELADRRYRACVAPPAPDRGAGLRVGVKDTVDVKGFPTRLGLTGYRHDPDTSAAVLGGLPPESVNAKLVTTELSIGLEHGCTNPYFPHLDPGGSSTGCAVAVAAGICDLAMGTDTVASVRLPAGACGVVGLRLSHDRRLLKGLFGLSPHLDAPGWITRTADDLAAAWNRFSLRGARTVDDPVRPRTHYRVGVVDEATGTDVDPVVREAFEQSTAALADAGHEVVTVRLGELFHRRGLAYELCAREAWDSYRPLRERLAHEISESTRLALEAGARVTDTRYRQLLDLHLDYRSTAARLLAAGASGTERHAGLDAWLMPAGNLLPRNIHTEPAPASTIPDPAETGRSPHVNYAAVASLTGLPALTFPVAHSPVHDAPVSLQAVGPAGGEPVLISLAQQITALTGGVGFVPRLVPEPTPATAGGTA